MLASTMQFSKYGRVHRSVLIACHSVSRDTAWSFDANRSRPCNRAGA